MSDTEAEDLCEIMTDLPTEEEDGVEDSEVEPEF